MPRPRNIVICKSESVLNFIYQELRFVKECGEYGWNGRWDGIKQRAVKFKCQEYRSPESGAMYI